MRTLDRSSRPPGTTVPIAEHSVSVTHLKRRRTERTTRSWVREISRRGESRAFRLTSTGAKPAVRKQLRLVSRAVAFRYYQLLSGHTLTAVFEEKWGWISSDQCSWRGNVR